MPDRCIAPGELREGDFVAYLEGAADEHVRQHIASCAFCRAEAAELRDADSMLHGALYRASCPDLDELLQFQAALLGAHEQRRIARHVDDCPHCPHELRELTLSAAPHLASALPEQFAQTGKRLLAALLLPPTRQSTLALRGNEPRRYEYQAGDYLVVLVVVPPIVVQSTWQLEGQLSARPDVAATAGANVALLRNDVAVAHDRVDEFGYFFFAEVAPGNVTVAVELPAERIVIRFGIP